MVVFTSFTPPVDGIVHQQTATKAFMNDKEIGSGTLYITETLLSWCDDGKRIGFSLQYPNISLHAIRREPFPALYVMLDHKLTLPAGLVEEQPSPDPAPQESEEEEEDDEEGEGQSLTELMFSPGAQDLLPRMFSAMSECQALHPDPEDDDDSDIYEDASGILDENYEPLAMEDAEGHMQNLHIGVNNGHANESNDDGEMDYDPDQFADVSD